MGYRKHRGNKKCNPLTEIEIDEERLALLLPFNERELLWEIAADVVMGHDLKKIAATKDGSLDELFKDAAADAASGKDLQGMAKQASLGKPGGKGASTQDNDETVEMLKEVTINKTARHDSREPPRRPDWRTSPCTCLVGRPSDPRKSPRRPGITSSVIVMSTIALKCNFIKIGEVVVVI